MVASRWDEGRNIGNNTKKSFLCSAKPANAHDVFMFFVFLLRIKVCGACMYFGQDLNFQPEKTTLLRKSDKVDGVFIIFENEIIGTPPAIPDGALACTKKHK